MRASVAVETAHLANPVVALSRLLASEARAFANVTGDEHRIEVILALDEDSQETSSDAQAWVRWAIHNAGIRGHIHFHSSPPE